MLNVYLINRNSLTFDDAVQWKLEKLTKIDAQFPWKFVKYFVTKQFVRFKYNRKGLRAVN